MIILDRYSSNGLIQVWRLSEPTGSIEFGFRDCSAGSVYLVPTHTSIYKTVKGLLMYINRLLIYAFDTSCIQGKDKVTFYQVQIAQWIELLSVNQKVVSSMPSGCGDLFDYKVKNPRTPVELLQRPLSFNWGTIWCRNGSLVVYDNQILQQLKRQHNQHNKH